MKDLNQSSKRKRLDKDSDDVLRPSDDLYVMKFSESCGLTHLGVKIGRSNDVAQRSKEMSSGLPLNMEVCYIAKGIGRLEGRIHAHFENRRTENAHAREWFLISEEEAIEGIKQVRMAYETECADADQSE